MIVGTVGTCGIELCICTCVSCIRLISGALVPKFNDIVAIEVNVFSCWLLGFNKKGFRFV